MPCHDGGVPYPPTEKEKLDAQTPAMLCAILSALTDAQINSTLDVVEWREAGVTKTEAKRWWKLHKEEDAERKRFEAEKAERAKLLKSARSKLNHAEREALGLVADDTHDKG